MKLKFEKKNKRDAALTVRLKKETVDQLKEIAAKYNVSQADVIEKLVEEASASTTKAKKK